MRIPMRVVVAAKFEVTTRTNGLVTTEDIAPIDETEIEVEVGSMIAIEIVVTVTAVIVRVTVMIAIMTIITKIMEKMMASKIGTTKIIVKNRPIRPS